MAGVPGNWGWGEWEWVWEEAAGIPRLTVLITKRMNKRGIWGYEYAVQV
jgi:hypothetical protein